MLTAMQMREAAERVLFAETLEEKLFLPPLRANDDHPGKAIACPEQPGRPQELKISAKGVRVEFPGTNRLDDDRERGVMLHFLANHELLATELMALVLLRFPDAPKEYRVGVYEAMREEQMHTAMYLRRMRDCGITFGELPVNDYFWRLVAPMRTPMDFVTRLNLTFEQANLDFSKHYAGLFRQAGDASTAAVLEKIYLDEIGHVGHGLKWFRRWKEQGCTDWQAYQKSLVFPMAPARAKGLAPFNAEGRRLAGLDEDFIQRLEVSGQSRGRTPVVHWFNPNAESHVLAAVGGKRYDPNASAAALETDLEMLLVAACRRDDVLVMRQPPGTAHLAALQRAGFELPEILTVDGLAGRKLGGLRPWAWSPDASAELKSLVAGVSERSAAPWREPLPAWMFGKEAGLRLEEMLDCPGERGVICRDVESALAEAGRQLAAGEALFKAPYACAGRGHLRISAASDGAHTRAWLESMLAAHGYVVVERWLERVVDFSALFELDGGGQAELCGMTRMENDLAGRFLGTLVAPKWGALLTPELAGFFYRDARAMEWYQERIPDALVRLLPGYSGPVGVDAMIHRRADGKLALKWVVELNIRMSMGRIALELLEKSAPGRNGRLRLLRRASLSDEAITALGTGSLRGGPVLLNDPAAAKVFVGLWEVADGTGWRMP